MLPTSLRATISLATDNLLSTYSSPEETDKALASLERVLAALALDDPGQQQGPPLLDAFLALQDGFEYNITSALLEWVGRTVGEMRRGQSADETTKVNLARCLGLVQGLLLLHRRSQRLFARRSALEYILLILATTRPSHLTSPTLPTSATVPSPVLLPHSPAPSRGPSPTRSASSGSPPSNSSNTSLALISLDTLLCALVDRPRNMRAFEDVGGLAAIVKVLKDKAVAQPVRIKAIEILYYYLLPERPSRRETSSSSSTSSTSTTPSTPTFPPPTLPILLASAASDFVPQTPMKPRFPSSHRRHPSSSSSSLEVEDRGRPNEDDPDGTPRPRRTAPPPVTPPRGGGGGGMAVRVESPTPTRVAPPPHYPSSAPTTPTKRQHGRSTSASSGGGGRERPPMTRTTAEKRELLRVVMPNVEALEHRFEAMGLGGWER